MEIAELEKINQVVKELAWAKRHLEAITSGDFNKTTVKIQSDKAEIVLSGRFFDRPEFLLSYKYQLEKHITELTNQILSI